MLQRAGGGGGSAGPRQAAGPQLRTVYTFVILLNRLLVACADDLHGKYI